MKTVILICALLTLFLASELLVWFLLRFRGIKLSFWEFQHPFIHKNLFDINHNNKVFDALEIIQNNKLDLSIQELEELDNANIDFIEFVDAMLLAKERDVKVSKEVLRELAYFKKDLIEIVKSKNNGEEILIDAVVKDYVIQTPVANLKPFVP